MVPGALTCRRKFLRFFPHGFRDAKYVSWEREYKWLAHQRWKAALEQAHWRVLLKARRYRDIARQALSIESRTNLLFSFEKMAIRDAVRETAGARPFAQALFDFLYAGGDPERRFNDWVAAVGTLPRVQTRVLTWPVVTVFPFIADPTRHIFLKPMVTRAAATAYGASFDYTSRPTWTTYQQLVMFAERIRRDQRDLRPRDMIDLQSFIWVQGSDEYEE